MLDWEKKGDWLDDPLTIPDPKRISWTIRKPNPNLLSEESGRQWWSFHFATRLKLEGSVYFCSQLLGPGKLSNDIGLPLLNHRLGMWYSYAFFFTLCSAYDTLLQELNVIYKLGFAVDKVNWWSMKQKLPGNLSKTMEDTRAQSWFKEIFAFRNVATHHYLVPMEKSEMGLGEQSWGLQVDELRLVYFDNETKKVVREDIHTCEDYLRKMLSHIHEVWKQTAEKFE